MICEREMYLVKWRADYVTQYADKTVARRAIEDVKWTNKHTSEDLGNGIGYNYS